jgi:tRNA U34 2-thiouridine synthase MnmA/TrmU
MTMVLLFTRRGRAARGRTFMMRAGSSDQLGIPHYVLDYESRFRTEVIDRLCRQLYPPAKHRSRV